MGANCVQTWCGLLYSVRRSYASLGWACLHGVRRNCAVVSPFSAVLQIWFDVFCIINCAGSTCHCYRSSDSLSTFAHPGTEVMSFTVLFKATLQLRIMKGQHGATHRSGSQGHLTS